MLQLCRCKLPFQQPGIVPSVRVNSAVVIVDGSIDSLNVAVMAVTMATSVAELAGLVDKTVGGVRSGAVVVNDHE